METKDEGEMITIVLEEVTRCRQELLKAAEVDRPLWRRIYVRSAFAAIEACCEWMRETVYLYHGIHGAKHDQAKISALSGLRHSIGSKGEIVTARERTPFLHHVIFAMEVFAEHFTVPFKVDRGGTDWGRFTRAAAVRNRITHPKTGADLKISEEECEDVYLANKWFQDSVYDVLEKTKHFDQP